jgi:hypothetical protein
LDVSEGVRRMLHMWHGMLRRQRFFSVLSRMFLIVVLVLVLVTTFVLEVNGALVFMRLAILITVLTKIAGEPNHDPTHKLIPP